MSWSAAFWPGGRMREPERRMRENNFSLKPKFPFIFSYIQRIWSALAYISVEIVLGETERFKDAPLLAGRWIHQPCARAGSVSPPSTRGVPL